MDLPQISHEPRQLLVGAVLMVATGIFQTFGVVVLEEFADRHRERVARNMTRLQMLGTLSSVICYLFALHLLEMCLWAVVLGALADYPSFATSLYESALAFTTMDTAELPPQWQFLSAAEAITGLLMLAWSTSVLFNQTSWVTEARRKYLRKHHLFGSREPDLGAPTAP